MKISNPNDHFNEVLLKSNKLIADIQISKLQKGHDYYEKFYIVDQNEKEKLEKFKEHEKYSIQKAFDYCKTYNIPVVDEFIL